MSAGNSYPTDFQVTPIAQDMGIGDPAPNPVTGLPYMDSWRHMAQAIALETKDSSCLHLAQQVVQLCDHVDYLRARHQAYKCEIYRSHYVPNPPAAKVDPA